MGILNLFSKRQRSLRGEIPEVFRYDEIPNSLRVQVIHIWKDAIGEPSNDDATQVYRAIHNLLCREYGVFAHSEDHYNKSPFEHLGDFLLQCEDHERILDVIELSFRCIENISAAEEYRWKAKPSISPDAAIDELNTRFLEHGIGYQYESGTLIRKDSELLHSEVVRPALELLTEERYAGANEEFLKAHEHYRHARYKECFNDCLKAFESTMKCICDTRRWHYNKNDTAKKLIEICLSKGLIPQFHETQLGSLRALLESGVPTTRNKLSGHGQGSQQVIVPQYYASYLLHITASTIKFLIGAEKSQS